MAFRRVSTDELQPSSTVDGFDVIGASTANGADAWVSDIVDAAIAKHVRPDDGRFSELEVRRMLEQAVQQTRHRTASLAASPPPPPAEAEHRADVDGLRAVAVVAVILYHLDHALLPGGFVGVDIFFVISGFVVPSARTAATHRGGRPGGAAPQAGG